MVSVVEQRVGRLRYEREEVRAVIKTGIEEKGLVGSGEDR